MRCAQTASSAATPLGVKELHLCTALAETMSEDWYRSWATPGSDSTWGGSGENTVGNHVERSLIHPAALGPSFDCFMDAEALTTMLTDHGDKTGVKIVTTEGIQHSSPFLPYNWDSPEKSEEQAARMKQFCYGVKDSDAFNGSEAYSVLLVSHGGPTTGLYSSLSGTNKHPSTGYTGLYAYCWDKREIKELESEKGSAEEGRWKALIIANHDHLKHVTGATMSGPNDMVEQAEEPESP